MDIYVLTENGVVLGAGTDRSACEDIADRRGDRWGEWFEERDDEWRRIRSVTVGGILRDIQRIVRTPLAGYIRDWPALGSIDETGPALLRDVPALTTRIRIAQANEQGLYESLRPRNPFPPTDGVRYRGFV